MPSARRSSRKLLTAFAAVAVAGAAALVATATGAAPGMAAETAAASPTVLPMTVTNNSGRNDAVHLYVIGTSGGRWGYVNASGTFTPWTGGGLPPTPAPDVSIPGPGNGGSTTLRIPKGLSGRVYMALGEKLKFSITPDGFVQPAPWAPGDPNYNVLFDTSEFTYNDAGLWLNSSQVDMFAVPHAVTVTGSGGTKRTGDVVNDGRNRIINAIKAQPAFSRSVITRGDGTVLRVLAPGKATDAGLFDPNYLNSYIDTAWSAYSNRALTVAPRQAEPNRKFFGRTSGNVMRFTDASGAQVATVDKPSTSNVWGCDGVFNAPNTPPFIEAEIKRTLCTALVRGTLGTFDVEPNYVASNFYKNSAPNHYSRIIHEHMVDGKAYGFAYDDVGGFESLVHDGDPQSAGIIISPFGAGGTQPPPPPPATGNSIISNWNNKCIDVPNWQFNDGVRLVMWNCTGSNNQAWQFVNGTIRTENNKCMDVAGGSTANGTPIQIANCSTNPAQQFVLNGAGDLVNPQANKCVDIDAWNPNNDAVLIIWECSGGANQKWRRG